MRQFLEVRVRCRHRHQQDIALTLQHVTYALPVTMDINPITASDDRVRVGDSTQVQTRDRALRVHRFVIGFSVGFSGLAEPPEGS